ncbi:hypothetical protein NQ314_021173, partial [Rhamnusium bicolor]
LLLFLNILPSFAELVLLENAYKDQTAYRFEDFFGQDLEMALPTMKKILGAQRVLQQFIRLKRFFPLCSLNHHSLHITKQQDRHLGINGRIKREVEDKPVNVYIHKVDKSKLNGDNKIEVLYHVSVAGKPVSAITAANDMHLVSDDEVRQELGYPFLIKAEPYLKPSEPQSLSRAKNTWIFIGVSIIGFLLFLLVVAFLTLGLTKRKRVPSPINTGAENRRHVFERGVGNENKGFVQDGGGTRRKEDSPTYINFKNENSTLTRSAIATSRPESSISSTSSRSVCNEIDYKISIY